ncbi:hypothetical protein [Neisseria sp. S1]|uniref:hypothetical protein n=1 Tax=Neisseria sp. S1 TaxID=3318354 RepID=UPI003A8AADDD
MIKKVMNHEEWGEDLQIGRVVKTASGHVEAVLFGRPEIKFTARNFAAAMAEIRRQRGYPMAYFM